MFFAGLWIRYIEALFIRVKDVGFLSTEGNQQPWLAFLRFQKISSRYILTAMPIRIYLFYGMHMNKFSNVTADNNRITSAPIKGSRSVTHISLSWTSSYSLIGSPHLFSVTDIISLVCLLGFWHNRVVLQINVVLFREWWLIMILMLLMMIFAMLFMFLLFAMMDYY